LAARFEVIVVSCELNSAKPAREMFERAATLFKLPPEEILHVGDSLAADVRGAQEAGFRAVQLERDAEALHDGQIRSLLDLLDFI
jgi:HAD superfamily hydrolase (TIGR01509 family)